jgi:hypothetical protein
VATLLIEEGGSAFFPWILIAPDDYSILVLPEIEDALTLFDIFHQMLFNSQIVVGIIACP